MIQYGFEYIHILDDFNTKKISSIEEIEPVQLVRHDKKITQKNGNMDREDNKNFKNKTLFKNYLCQRNIDDFGNIKENVSNIILLQ